MHDTPTLTKDAIASAVAIYAAAISTIALVISVVTATVQVRKALSEGVKLTLSAMAEAVIIGDPNTYVALTVVNRGTAATTLTHMVLFNYTSDIDIKRQAADFTASVNAVNIPYLLKPGEVWQGRVVHGDRLQAMLKSKRLHVGVISSHREQPFLLRLQLRASRASDPWAWLRRPPGVPPQPPIAPVG